MELRQGSLSAAGIIRTLAPGGRLAEKMSKIEIGPGSLYINASVIAQGLALEPSRVQAMMRKGKITSLCERGVNEDAGRYRLTFFHKSRRFRLIVDGTGTVIQRSIVDFGDRPLPAATRKLRT
jgi:hypothetical protein